MDMSERLTAAAQVGMAGSVWADIQPDIVEIYDPSGRTRTFGEVNAYANRIARLLRGAGLQVGDAVALLCSNRAEFVEVLSATLRTGLRITPVNWHLTADEIAYIVRDCDAKALFAEARIEAAGAAAADCPDLVLKVAIGGPIPGFADYETILGPLDARDIEDPVLGTQMMYTSGTTGRPKGVYRPVPPPATGAPLRGDYNHETDVQMCAGPAYHAAPLAFDLRASMLAGTPLVFIDRWESETVLRTISEKRVTHMHLVPIMFQRLLALPPEVRATYDVSHVKFIIHGAAPCPPEVKQAMIDWFGPVLCEYYAGSEGGAGFFTTSEEWLRKPGTVGKLADPTAARILDEQGRECPAGVAGDIYMRVPPGAGFEYYKDPTKTAANRRDGFFTMGDHGYFDDEGYLFLTGRNAETIISGGVNIYPQEIDNALIQHPAVEDAATVGIPHDEWGEQVRAVILLKAGHAPTPALAEEILGFARGALAAYKIPRGLDFVDSLPRSEAGKIQRNKVRAPYWEGRARQI